MSESECPLLAPVSCVMRCWCLTVSVPHTNDSEDDTQVGDRKPQLINSIIMCRGYERMGMWVSEV